MTISRRQLVRGLTGAATMGPSSSVALTGSGFDQRYGSATELLAGIRTRQGLIEAIASSEALARFLSGQRSVIVLERWNDGYPDQILRFAYSRERPDDDPSAIPLGPDYGYLAQMFESSVQPEQFGALRDGKADDTRSLRAASQLASRRRIKVQLQSGSYVVSSTIQLEIGPQSFEGTALQGAGVRSTVILFKPVRRGVPCIQMNGGSGRSTNKRVTGLTIVPHNADVAGSGTGIQVRGQCFSLVEDVEVEGLGIGLELVNERAREFTEFNRFNRLRLLDNRVGILMHRRGGADSFHGNIFRDVQVNIPEGGTGLAIGGRTLDGMVQSGTAFVYNCEFDLKLFGGSGDRLGIRAEQVNTSGNEGNITVEGEMRFHLESGNFRLNGPLTSIYPVRWSGAAKSEFGFDQATENSGHDTAAYQEFETPELSGTRMGYFGGLRPDGKINTIAPAVFPIIGPNIKAVGVAVYDGDPRNGLYLGSHAFDAAAESFSSRWFLRHDGRLLHVESDELTIQTEGTPGQLKLSGGRVGGSLGRLKEIALEPGPSPVQHVRILRVNEAQYTSMLFCRITGPNRLFARHMFARFEPVTRQGIIEIIQTASEPLQSSNEDEPLFAVDETGALEVTLTVDRPFVLTVAELALGHQLTE